MEHWDLRTLDVQPHQPQILHSSRGESRTIAIHLPAGESLQDHEVHERAHLVVVDGEVEVDADGGSVRGGPGFVAVFDPQERHEVRAESDARLLLVLAPVAGRGAPGRARRLSAAAGSCRLPASRSARAPPLAPLLALQAVEDLAAPLVRAQQLVARRDHARCRRRPPSRTGG